eukprot:CAMPEP_0195140586 /NCGR_PEP_ID=MMETSP0448-20130528/161405_1 /TAXON_ID=66468 /ORGANISM="Heterocapsa triquestra, Strain CCMP 448" /LENGTH=43 /DNA_ID= /DNA_START= /DNA_END= /DNA_ORIENTATION=
MPESQGRDGPWGAARRIAPARDGAAELHTTGGPRRGGAGRLAG